MNLLKVAKNETAFLKMGVYGLQGSGKTYTSSRIMAGLLKYSKVENPKVAMFDTEKSSDFLKDFFDVQGIDFFVIKSRAFKDLVDSIKEAESNGIHGFIVDSVTHVWRELMTSYQKKKKTGQLTMRDWGPIKDEWALFTNAFINSKMHFISLGRAGDVWEQVTNDQGKNELQKTGTKMKAEGEFGYESDILVEMERLRDSNLNKDIHRAWILKDRWDIIDGKYFDEPNWKNFEVIFKKLNIGGDHVGFGDSDSTSIFSDPDFSGHEKRKQQEIAVEELDAILTKLDLAGASAEAKKKRIETLEHVFGTSSRRAIEDLSEKQIRTGIKVIKDLFKKEDATIISSDQELGQLL